ncbi:hypothetical protein E4U52_000784 [Claviceps spartinae]|nr:hypothetical protein E4U52_000784 [Claviceps spartinae]
MFYLFSSLPSELRHYIWRLALPNSIGLTLQIYDEERWAGFPNQVKKKPMRLLPLGSVNSYQGGGFVLAPGQAQKLDRILRPLNVEREWQFINDAAPSSVYAANKAIRFASPEAVFWDPQMLECLPAIKQQWCDNPAKAFVIMGVQPERIDSTRQRSAIGGLGKWRARKWELWSGM